MKVLFAILLMLGSVSLWSQNFQVVWGTPFNPMSIYVTDAKLNGSDLQAGDEIAVFDVDASSAQEICVGAIVLSSVATPENFVEIICSMNDGTNGQQANGYTSGNSFVCRYYSQSLGEVQDVVISFPYSGYDEEFTALGTAILSLNGSAETLSQNLILKEGWNQISSFVNPMDTNIENLLAQISDELIVINNLTEVYFPDASVNTLGNWDVESGYQIKLNQEASISIHGTAVENTSLMLNAGWNLIPVLSDVDVVLLDLFSGHLDKVLIIKDAVGLEVFWPRENIIKLQLLKPGNSYLVKLSDPLEITF